MDIKQLLKERFNALFPNCTLWEINLSHPNFSVFYKEDNGLRHIDRLDSAEWNLGVVENYKDEGGNIESDNLPKTQQLFEGIDHSNYFEKAETIFYKNMDYWTCPF